MQDGISLLQRKAKVAREDFDARAMSPCKALRLSLEKMADALLDLALVVATVEQTVLAQSAVKAEMDGGGLLLLIDGTAGRLGGARLDAQFLAAVIEVQTMGAVQRGDAPERSVTPTDAAMVAPLMDAILKGFDEYLTSGAEKVAPSDWRFGDMVEDARTLALALEVPEYDLFRITADLADGAKTGSLSLLLPRAPRRDPVTSARDRAFAGPTLEASALNAPVMLDAVLARLSMPLNKLCALTPGMQLPVPREALNKAELLGAGQHLVAPVRLGQLNGWRAVRLLGGAEPGQGAPSKADMVAQDMTKPPVAEGAQTTRYLVPVDHGPAAPDTSVDHETHDDVS